jgi:hypothetical protein
MVTACVETSGCGTCAGQETCDNNCYSGSPGGGHGGNANSDDNSGDSDDLLYDNTPIQQFGANTFFNSLFNLMSPYLSGSSDSPLFSFQIARSIGGTFATIQTSYLGK